MHVHAQQHEDRAHGSVRIVVVDDDDGIRALLEVTVDLDSRFELVAASGCGADAIDALRSGEDVDAVLLDVTLPDADGIELVAAVRDAAPGAKVALFTGWSDEATLARARRAGADAIFCKDGDARGLLDSIAELVAAP
jgi:DNA-binding NarL/FixJ family response regulator